LANELVVLTRYIGEHARYYVIKRIICEDVFAGKVNFEGSILAQANTFQEAEQIIKNIKEREKRK
jgi:hypothetical protein